VQLGFDEVVQLPLPQALGEYKLIRYIYIYICVVIHIYIYIDI
jgi:hypothetical protein